MAASWQEADFKEVGTGRSLQSLNFCYSDRVTPGPGLSVHQNPKLQLWADMREVLESPSTHISVFLLFFHASWLRSGSESKGFLKIKANNTPCVTLTESRRGYGTKPRAPAGDREPAVQSGQPEAQSMLSLILRKCPWPRPWKSP